MTSMNSVKVREVSCLKDETSSIFFKKNQIKVHVWQIHEWKTIPSSCKLWQITLLMTSTSVHIERINKHCSWLLLSHWKDAFEVWRKNNKLSWAIGTLKRIVLMRKYWYDVKKLNILKKLQNCSGRYAISQNRSLTFQGTGKVRVRCRSETGRR